MPTFPSTAAFPASVLFPATATFPFGGLTLTNNQKLSLPANTQVGKRVQVTDGFVVSGDGAGDNAFYFPNGSLNGRTRYSPYPQTSGNDIYWSGTAWANDNGNFTNQDVGSPWLGTDFGEQEHGGAVATYPAVQQLTAPSTEQGGVFVLGGTQDGIYTKQSFQVGGRDAFAKLGVEGGGDIDDIYSSDNRWKYFYNGDWLYYSLSDVATPDLASNWKNASDDSPASITVTSVSVGDLVAGNKLGSVVRQVNGATNGRNKFTDVLAVAPDLTWDGMKWTDGTTNGSGNTAFPDIGSADPVAAEENWDTIP